MKKKQKGNKIKAVSNSVSKRIPFVGWQEDGGIIETKPGFYTVMYALGNIRMEDAGAFRQRMEYFFSSLPGDCSYQFVVHNGVIPKEDYLRTVLVEPDRLPNADKYNAVILDHVDVGHNNVRRKVYFIVGVKQDVLRKAISAAGNVKGRDTQKITLEQAALFFRERDEEFISLFGGMKLTRLSLLERLEILYQAFYPGRTDFGDVLDLDGSGEKRLCDLKYLGMTVKDLVAPGKWDTSAALLNATHLNGGSEDECFSRTLFLNGIPKEISSNVIGDLTGVSGNMMFSMICRSVDREVGFREATRRMQENMIVTKRLKRETIQDRKNRAVTQIATRKETGEGVYFHEAAQEMFKMAVASDGAVMETLVTVTLYARTMEELDRDTELLKLSAAKFACSVKPLDLCQYEGFCTTLPLCCPRVDVSRFLDSARLAGLSPVSVAALGRSGGAFLGLNSVNDNLIFLNRRSNGNVGGVIIGAEHSGKTYQMKQEIFNAMLSKGEKLYVVAPREDYNGFISGMGGDILQPDRWDPFYMTEGYGLIDGGDRVKERFLRALYGAEWQERQEQNAMDTAFSQIHGVVPETIRECDAGQDGRLFLYPAQTAEEILMLMDYLWNQMIDDRKCGKASRIFIEPIDALLRTEERTRYLMKYLQQCSAFGTVVTAVVQDAVGLMGNVEQSVALEELASACGYVKLLNLGPVERKKLAEALNIPGALLPYISNVEPSKGLILTSASNVPFDDNFLGKEDAFVKLFL